MTSTTSIHSRRPLIYTIVSTSAPLEQSSPFSIAILPRGTNPFFTELIEAVSRFNPEEILIVNARPHHHIDTPLRQIWIRESLQAGELVNIVMEEAKTPFVFILWNDMIFNAEDVSHHLFLRLEERQDLCATPQLYNAHGVEIPSLSMPVFPPNDIFRVLRTSGQNVEEPKTFMPLDFCGVYNRARFLNLGGYDTSITTEYWQKVEFGLRAAMWGEKIVLNPSLSVSYADALPVDDESINASTSRFALKTLSVRMSKKGAYLPRTQLFWLWGEENWLTTFKEIRQWVTQNRFRFKSDAELVVDGWQSYQSNPIKH
ncbi:hypothetical protein PVA45_05180 [Entomospira entomophila]|uniref:Uncharacterized protein n=1 Tax=Entomospira entomophila TaxID=2719988 RepID=A0A968KTZ2_9SPIO|nr:hypothetical protein [Entomospira entomophilus]NIZ40891.1 hypothetical protein [Entomospira entomophilus]WDI35104.1 hypothetical protein PVA45_05180 [Entomospira entomophilus]